MLLHCFQRCPELPPGTFRCGQAAYDNARFDLERLLQQGEFKQVIVDDRLHPLAIQVSKDIYRALMEWKVRMHSAKDGG